MAAVVFIHGVGERPGPGGDTALAEWVGGLAAPMPDRLGGWLRANSAMAYYQDWDWLDGDVANLRRPSHTWATVKAALSDAVEEARAAYDEVEPKRIADLGAVAERWAESERVLAASNLAADQVSAFNLWQVSAFLEDIEGSRQQVLDRFGAAVGPDTRVIIAHSLGSVVAYEAAHETGLELDALITLGSPPPTAHRLASVAGSTSATQRNRWPSPTNSHRSSPTPTASPSSRIS